MEGYIITDGFVWQGRPSIAQDLSENISSVYPLTWSSPPMVVVVDDLLKIRMINVKSVASFLSDTDSLSQGARSDSHEQAPNVNNIKIIIIMSLFIITIIKRGICQVLYTSNIRKTWNLLEKSDSEESAPFFSPIKQ